MGKTCDLLIVDDDVGQAQLIASLIRDLELSHRCHHVTDGVKALDFLQHRPPFESAPRPALILLDLNMPGLSGCEVLRSIKADADLRTIPVIILSQSQGDADVNACYGEYANAYIGKPADLDGNRRLVHAVEHFWMHVAQLP